MRHYEHEQISLMPAPDNRAAMLVQDFAVEPDTFFLGIKSLNTKSVVAAKDMKTSIVPVVAKHLCRELPAEVCRSGGRIDPSRSALNYSLLPGRMTGATITAQAIAGMEENEIKWRQARKDQVMGVEFVFSLPPGFKHDERIFFTECLRWTERHYPQPARIIAAIVHLDEAVPHLHVLLVPIVAQGRMSGHDVVGYKGLYTKRVNSFHEEVAQRFGLRKPRCKGKMTSTRRHHLADRTIDKLMADGWVASPASVKEMHRMLFPDPLPMAQSMGLSAHEDSAIESQQNAYAVAVDDVRTLPDGATALLCNAVASSTTANDAGIDHPDASKTPPAGSAASSSIVPGERPRLKQWVEIMTGVMPPERPAWSGRSPHQIPPPSIVPSKLDRVGTADATEPPRGIPPPTRTSARTQVLLGLRVAGHIRGHA